MSTTTAQDRPGQTEKLAAIGQMVATVAHEINHPVTAILMTSSLVLSEMGEANPLRSDMETIRERTLHLRAILRNLLDYARPIQYYLENVSINVTVQDAVRFFRRQMESRGVECCPDYASRSPTVLADRHWLTQVFNNLIANALDAMPQGGSLTVRIRRRRGEAVAEIIDTGCGIPPENMGRIFEPFFTTKRNGLGIGLGLAISRNVTRELGGRIEVASQVGRGSTFTVRLPLLEPAENRQPMVSHGVTV